MKKTKPANAMSHLGALEGLLGRSEEFWTSRLANLAPITVPLSHNDARHKGGPEYIRQALHVPVGLRQTFSPAVNAAALFTVLLARLERISEFDLALSDARWSARIAGLEDLVSREGCIRVRVKPDQTFEAVAAELEPELNQLVQRGSWLRDLFERQPSLRAVRGGTVQIPVAIALSEDSKTWEPQIDRPLTLVCFRDGAAVLVADQRHVSLAALRTLAAMFDAMADNIAANGFDRSVSQAALLDQDTLHRVVHEWNQTDAPYPAAALIHSQIEEQAGRTPERTALVFEEVKLTYGALTERVNLVAARLSQLGVGPDQPVGIYIDRSIELVIAILAVLKAGGAYLPLDPDFPKDRLTFMMQDSRAKLLLTAKAPSGDPALSVPGVKTVRLDELLREPGQPKRPPPCPAQSDNLAYVLYTSGSTGRPKGVMVEHRNVTNFFTGMDACIQHDPPGVWLAVTSLSFDISVLELLWTLARGFTVIIQGGVESYFAADRTSESRPMGFSLFVSGNDDAPQDDKYRLMLEGAQYFDSHSFEAVWTPERHFHELGGRYPNPSVTGAALAAVTQRLGIRAGNCISPLHHPLRIAEEWALVDNLSSGRVGLSFVSDCGSNDFVLRPKNHAGDEGSLRAQIDQVRRLWRGERVNFPSARGEEVATATLPRPVQPELPFWITSVGNLEDYRLAGELGANVLTNLLGQTLEELAQRIASYRQARAAAGHDPGRGRVTLMLPTFVGPELEAVRELVREPMKRYLRGLLEVVLAFVWSSPAFKRPGRGAEKPEDVDLGSLSEVEIEAMLDFAFERYFESGSLFGTPATCARMVERCKQAGVDEIACLLDFGVPTEQVLASLPFLNQVREAANVNVSARSNIAQVPAHYSLAKQIQRHGVTHLQCTPSLARMLLLDPSTRAELPKLRQMLVGGEALPPVLARELQSVLQGELRNMYGPTETTIWSATQLVDSSREPIPIGRPLANTQIYILDAFGQPLPAGVPGELCIGGAGVARGYLGLPELTRERFLANPFVPKPGQRLYRTGDRARFLEDGTVEFLGRTDQQMIPNVKTDREALPLPQAKPDRGTRSRAPETPTEKALAGIWEKLLKRKVGTDDNFFDSGGHSLMSMQLMAQVRKAFGVNLPLKNLFERPTIAALAEAIDALSWAAAASEPVPSGDVREDVLL